MLKKVWLFVKDPVYREYPNAPLEYKKKLFLYLLAWSLLLGFSLSLASGILTQLFGLEVGKHASEELFSLSPALIILFAVVVAPILEELLFRAPLKLFRKPAYFKYAYYCSAIAFGAMHITNFEISQQVLWLAPILVAPQICMGFFLGYIRVRLGLVWSILLHAAYNTVLMVPLILLKALNIPFE